MMSGNADIGILIGHLLMGVGFLLISIYVKKNPPASINGWYGYRTSLSMKNQDTWMEANTYSSGLMVITAWVNIICGVTLYVCIGGLKSIQIAGTILAVLSVLMIVATEMHLKRMFDGNGNRKTEKAA